MQLGAFVTVYIQSESILFPILVDFNYWYMKGRGYVKHDHGFNHNCYASKILYIVYLGKGIYSLFRIIIFLSRRCIPNCIPSSNMWVCLFPYNLITGILLNFYQSEGERVWDFSCKDHFYIFVCVYVSEFPVHVFSPCFVLDFVPMSVRTFLYIRDMKILWLPF